LELPRFRFAPAQQASYDLTARVIPQVELPGSALVVRLH
jgi:hypothetical protein